MWIYHWRHAIARTAAIAAAVAIEAAARIAALAAHVAATDPHAQCQKESEKNQASGYPSLTSAGKLIGIQQTYGAAGNTACEGNDSRLTDGRPPPGARPHS